MSRSDAGPLDAGIPRREYAIAGHRPTIHRPAPVTPRAPRPALGRPAVVGARSASTSDRTANWRLRIASIERPGAATARPDANWSPRLVTESSAPNDASNRRSLGATRPAPACAGQSALDSARLRGAPIPGARARQEHDADRVTKRQLQFIRALARECNVGPAELEWSSRQLFGAGVATLSRDGAKRLIDRLARALEAVA